MSPLFPGTFWLIHCGDIRDHVLGTVQFPERKTALGICRETMISIFLLENLGTGWLCDLSYLLKNASSTLSETISS